MEITSLVDKRERQGRVKIVIEVVREVGLGQKDQRLEVESFFETGADQRVITEGLQYALNWAVAELHELRVLAGDRPLTVSRRVAGGIGCAKDITDSGDEDKDLIENMTREVEGVARARHPVPDFV